MHYQRAHMIPVALGFLAAGALMGCSPAEHDAVVATVGTQQILLSEFKQAQARNDAGADSAALTTTEEHHKLLDLLVNFHLKLLDAYRHGLDKTAEFRNEMNDYKGTLASSYLTENQVVEPGIHRLYHRRQEEVRASHILLSLAPNASPADSAAVYKRAYQIIAELQAGANFDSLATAVSQDPSVPYNHGDLYYFTAGDMVAPFEQAAFSLKPGEITLKPVRTVYGLHIVKVFDRHPTPGSIRCSHIMIRIKSPGPTPADTLAAYARIVALQDSLAHGVDFAALAKRHSEDPGSAREGGDLGWFNRRKWIQSFDEVAFTLKPGQVSQIVRTPYGYHLIKCTGVKPPPTFEEAKQDLRQLYQRMYFKQDQQKYLAGLESEVHFTQHDSVTSLLWAAVDSAESHKDSSWTARISPSLGAATVMSIGGRTVSVDSLVSLLKSNPAMQTAKPTRLALADEAQKISENIVFAAKADLLVHTDPMFASLMNQYADGLLLYQIEQDRVWNSVAGNDSLLHIFFESHRDSYTFPDRVKFSQIHLLTAEDAAAAHRLLKGGMTMESIVTYDSLRLRSPDMSSVTFGRHGTALTRDAMKTLDGIGKQMNVDGAMSIELIAHVDTIRRVADSTLQASRQAAIADYLTRTQGVGAGRIHRVEQPLPAAHDARTRKARAESGLRIDIRAMGRRPVVNGRVAAFVLADSADARARVADSLAAGDCSAPLKYGDGYVIVRLDGREPARRKTYEEAAGEVSSAYQELESKRLTDEWMKELRSAFPVVEHREVLDQALAQHP